MDFDSGTLYGSLHLRVAGEGGYAAVHVAKASPFNRSRALTVGIALLSTCAHCSLH
jgi:hypothetical protein